MDWLSRLFPLRGRDDFARQMVQRFRSGGWSGEIEYDAETFELRLGPGGRDQVVFLHNVYADCRKKLPWQRRETQERFAAALQPSPSESLWQEARTRIVPAVRDPFLFEAARLQCLVRGQDPMDWEVATQELTERLSVCLMLDLDTSLRAVSSQDLARWEITFEEALRQGLYNLAERTRTRWTSPCPGVYVSAWNDDHDVSRLLLDKVFRGLDVRGDIVAIVPDRNRLIVTGTDDPAALAKALELALAESPRPVSAVPLLRRWPTWEPLILPEDHPCHALWSRVSTKESFEIYRQQKELLERLHEKKKEDLFVASYQVVEDTRTGLRTSYCVWGLDVRSLLPKTDRIFFVDLGGPGGQTVEDFPWDVVETCCGDLLQPTQDLPRRYLVQGFPADEQLAHMREVAGGIETPAARLAVG
jgi:hypothetical protein